MERDRDEWRRPWRPEDTPDAAAPVYTGPLGGEATGATTGTGTGADAGGEPASAQAPTGDTERITSYPQPPPAGFGEGHQGPGSPAGSVRPPDTTGTVDAPAKPRRGLGLGAVVVAALVGALAATGITLGVTELGTTEQAADTSGGGDGGTTEIQIDGEVNEVVPAVAQAVTPSVVSITIESQQGQPGQLPFGQEQQPGGLGSGVIYREDGYILTNDHVVEGADTVRVRLSNGDILDAEVVGSDPLNDLAVVQVETDEGLPPIEIRPEDEQVVVGETVVAIGSPFGLEGSVTSGIVSALNRDLSIPDEQNQGVALTIPSVIQTDAAINPGNSGGALVDARGRLVGLNTAILTGSGANQGVGFAVPADQAISSADQLIEQGFVRHPLLGVTGNDVSPELAEEFGLDASRGALVDSVQDGTGADEAGLAAGDIIVEVDGEELASMSELVAVVRAREPGDELELTIVRDGEEQQVTVELGERPREGSS